MSSILTALNSLNSESQQVQMVTAVFAAVFPYIAVLHHIQLANPRPVVVVNAAGVKGPFSYDFRCAQGAFINSYAGSSTSLNSWIRQLGPVGCSDGGKSTNIWGTTGPVAFTIPSSGTLTTGCPGFDVAFDNFGITRLDFTVCGDSGGVFGYVSFNSASLRCPTGLAVIGVFGTYYTDGNGLGSVGLFCQ